MPTPAERLALLMQIHGDSYRSVAERCGLDHTTLMRVARGETENPATLAKIANEGYGVPVTWLRGDRDRLTDFTFSVLTRPLQERVMFLWERGRRVAFALNFLVGYDPGTYTIEGLASIMEMSCTEVQSIISQGIGAIPGAQLERLCEATSLPLEWFRTGLIGWEDEEEILVGLASMALSSLVRSLGADFSEDEIHQAATAMV